MTVETVETFGLDPKRLSDVAQVVAVVDELVEDGQEITCRECGTTLPSDEPCTQEGGQHEPDQELSEPGQGEASTRLINVALAFEVPNDGYDYAIDVTGRLEQVLRLIVLHPLISRASTRSGVNVRTGSGYDGPATQSLFAKANGMTREQFAAFEADDI